VGYSRVGSIRSMFERYKTVVRCDRGHLYTTIWMPLVSIKAIRLGNARLQRCPVGGHWANTRKVNPEELSPEQAAEAAAVHDARVP
jgi:hypothetical protein